MKHAATDGFRERYERLPVPVRRLTDNGFAIIRQYPRHPLLRLLTFDDYVSMRIGSRHRALAVQENDTLIWFWIGTYTEYRRLFE